MFPIGTQILAGDISERKQPSLPRLPSRPVWLGPVLRSAPPEFRNKIAPPEGGELSPDLLSRRTRAHSQKGNQ
jgi:hypothetical protein